MKVSDYQWKIFTPSLLCECCIPLKFLSWNLSHVMALGSGSFGRWLGREAGALVLGLASFQERTPRALSAWTPREDAVRKGFLWTRRRASPNWVCWRFPMWRTLRHKFLLFTSHTAYGIVTAAWTKIMM